MTRRIPQATIGTPEALALIDRPRLYTWLMQMKKPDGAFTMHQDGENDVRGAYCAVSIATLCNIVTPELFEGTADWIVSVNPATLHTIRLPFPRSKRLLPFSFSFFFLGGGRVIYILFEV